MKKLNRVESEVTQKWIKCSSKLTVQYPINPFSTNVPLQSLALLLAVNITQSHLWVFEGGGEGGGGGG